MAFYERNSADYQGYGVYEHWNGQSGLGVSPVVGKGRLGVPPISIPPGMRTRGSLGQLPFIPSPDQLLAGAVQTDAAGIRAVRPDARSQVVAFLEALVPERIDTTKGIDPAAIKIVPGKQFPQTSNPQWITKNTAIGFATLAKVYGSTILGIGTKQPSVVAKEAGPGGSYVVVDAPEAVVQEARALLAQKSCPGGQTYSPAQGKCIPFPGGVTDKPGVTPRPSLAPKAPPFSLPSKLPTWVPIAGAVAIGTVIVVLMARGRPEAPRRRTIADTIGAAPTQRSPGLTPNLSLR